MSRYSKTQLMSVLPAESAHRFWARIGETLPRCRERHAEIETARSQDHVAGHTTPAPAVPPAQHRVTISANFDERNVCVEVSYAKEDGSHFGREEIAALLAANSNEGGRMWTKTNEQEWHSDDGFGAALGKTGLGSGQFCHWMRICRESIPRRGRQEPPVRAALPKPPFGFRARAPKPPDRESEPIRAPDSRDQRRTVSRKRLIFAIGTVLGVAILAALAVSARRSAAARKAEV